MNVNQKKMVRWHLDGKRVPAGTPNATKQVTLSGRFFGMLRTSDGKRKQVPLTDDRQSSVVLLRRLQAEEDRFLASGIDRQTRNKNEPIEPFLLEFESELRSRGRTELHVVQTINRIRDVLKKSKAKSLADLDTGTVSQVLHAMRTRGKKPLSQGSSNHYARAVKSFSRWLWQGKKTTDDVLCNLKMVTVTQKRQRGTLSASDIGKLLTVTENSRKTLCGLRAVDRAMLYRLALFTGLRYSELQSLTPSSIDLEAKTIRVEAAYSKHRRDDVLPLHDSIVERLREWLIGKNGKLFDGWKACRNHGSMMISRDLKRAGIPSTDARGKRIDFHALRHTFITSLARSGVHPSKAKALARHSTITLTMDVYSHVETDELRESVNCLPSVEDGKR